jgi:hypothetical protein
MGIDGDFGEGCGLVGVAPSAIWLLQKPDLFTEEKHGLKTRHYTPRSVFVGVFGGSFFYFLDRGQS